MDERLNYLGQPGQEDTEKLITAIFGECRAIADCNGRVITVGDYELGKGLLLAEGIPADIVEKVLCDARAGNRGARQTLRSTIASYREESADEERRAERWADLDANEYHGRQI